MMITIIWSDGKKETRYIDSYEVCEGVLMLYKRFGEDRGTTYIPLEKIKEFKLE